MLDKIEAVLNPSKASALRESQPEMMPINENDISSIKHSKVVNISSITIPQMDSLCQEKLIDMYEEQSNIKGAAAHLQRDLNSVSRGGGSQRRYTEENGTLPSDVRIS